jgi:hypothetical protein
LQDRIVDHRRHALAFVGFVESPQFIERRIERMRKHSQAVEEGELILFARA